VGNRSPNRTAKIKPSAFTSLVTATQATPKLSGELFDQLFGCFDIAGIKRFERLFQQRFLPCESRLEPYFFFGTMVPLLRFLFGYGKIG
jgi:hypothetical protein